jgi:hypothetical protein
LLATYIYHNGDYEMNNINNVRQLKLAEIETVAGAGDFWDTAEGALSGAGIGAGAIGFAAAIGAVATAPVTLAVIGGGALIGGAWGFFAS